MNRNHVSIVEPCKYSKPFWNPIQVSSDGEITMSKATAASPWPTNALDIARSPAKASTQLSCPGDLKATLRSIMICSIRAGRQPGLDGPLILGGIIIVSFSSCLPSTISILKGPGTYHAWYIILKPFGVKDPMHMTCNLNLARWMDENCQILILRP